MTARAWPAGVDGEAVRARLRDRHGITVAGGQGELDGPHPAHRRVRRDRARATSCAASPRSRWSCSRPATRSSWARASAAFSRAHARMRILVTETIAAAGIDRLREAAEVDVATGLDRAELLSASADYDALVVRSATRSTPS